MRGKKLREIVDRLSKDLPLDADDEIRFRAEMDEDKFPAQWRWVRLYATANNQDNWERILRFLGKEEQQVPRLQHGALIGEIGVIGVIEDRDGAALISILDTLSKELQVQRLKATKVLRDTSFLPAGCAWTASEQTGEDNEGFLAARASETLRPIETAEQQLRDLTFYAVSEARLNGLTQLQEEGQMSTQAGSACVNTLANAQRELLNAVVRDRWGAQQVFLGQDWTNEMQSTRQGQSNEQSGSRSTLSATSNLQNLKPAESPSESPAQSKSGKKKTKTSSSKTKGGLKRRETGPIDQYLVVKRMRKEGLQVEK